MPYRDNDRLGPRASEHRISRGGSATWLGAGVLSVVLVPLFLYWAKSNSEASPKLAIGALVMGGLAVWAFKEWWRLRAIEVSLHANGIRYSSGQTTTLEILWSEIVSLQARYVPGGRKRGITDEGNRVALVVRTATGSFSIPKELESAREVWKTVEERTGRSVDKVVVESLMDR